MVVVIERERMARVWWEVTGQYDTVDNRGKAIKQSFCNVFKASGKTDAINQAKKFFAEMQREDPAGKYANFTKINAKVER